MFKLIILSSFLLILLNPLMHSSCYAQFRGIKAPPVVDRAAEQLRRERDRQRDRIQREAEDLQKKRSIAARLKREKEKKEREINESREKAKKAATQAKEAANKAAKQAEDAAKEAAKQVEEAAKKAAEQAQKVAEEKAADLARVHGVISNELSEAEATAAKELAQVSKSISDAVDELPSANTRLLSEINKATDDLANAWKVNGKHLSKDWKEFVDYFDGVDKTIYEADVELTKEKRELTIAEAVNHLNVKIEVHCETGKARVSLKNERSGEWVLQDVGLDEGETLARETGGVFTEPVHPELSHPILKLELAPDGTSNSSRIHVRLSQRRGTFIDAFGGPQTANPHPEPEPVRKSSYVGNGTVISLSKTEITELANEVRNNQGRGYYIFFRYMGTEAWYGPYELPQYAIQYVEETVRNFAEFIGDNWSRGEPQFFEKPPE